MDNLNKDGSMMDALVLSNIADQIVSLDAQYVEQRNSKSKTVETSNLYMKWRRSLLQKKVQQSKLFARTNGDRRDDYFKIRSYLLSKKYIKEPKLDYEKEITSIRRNKSSGALSEKDAPLNAIARSVSNSFGKASTVASRRLSQPTPLKPQDTISLNTNLSNSYSNLNIVHEITTPTKLPSQTPSSPIPTPPPVPDMTPDYSFSGMHHIFGECKKGVTHARFGHGSKEILAFASRDLVVYLCLSVIDAPGVTFQLKGHMAEITDIAFSPSNSYLASTALDSTIRVWETKTGVCTKLLKDMGVCLALCFHPKSDANLFASDSRGNIKAISLRDGKVVKSTKASAMITCLTFEPKGGVLFTGDDKGHVQIFRVDKDGYTLTPSLRAPVLGGKPIPVTSIHFIYVRDPRSTPPLVPFLMINAKDNLIHLFTVKNTTPTTLALSPYREIPIINKKESIHSTFCPSLTFRSAPCLVSGAEDGGIYFFDARKKDDKPLNTLMGHGAPVVDVCWNFDESLLVSADTLGTVILWSRVKIEKKPPQ
eukprot:TRINITY_DN1939_c2_g1_i1.p1 TRINITY_DN1939_c2_g1~~TRINITY_DN1939_c2_g1_i1.p1  ORF type:complete len:537 (-),score=107.23 TRINITY_DN1939_c2_g1_i1:88-1698(-)